MKKLVESALSTTTIDLLASKKREVLDTPTVLPDSIDDSNTEVIKEWVRFSGGLVLTVADKKRILDGEKLDDRHVDLAQNLLKQLFSELGGLQSTLLQAKPLKQPRDSNKKKKIQIVHSRGDHWIVAATMLANDKVFVYNSVYHTIDQTTKSILSNLFPASTSTKLVQVNKQKGRTKWSMRNMRKFAPCKNFLLYSMWQSRVEIENYSECNY